MLKNISSRWAATLVTMAGGYVLMPFLVTHLGRDGYGTWTIATSMTSIMGLLMLGAPLASLRYLSQAVATQDREEANRIVGSCLGLYLIMAALAAGVGTLLFLFFTHYPIPPALRAGAYGAYAVAVLSTALGFLSRLPMGILSAHEDFVVQSRITIASDVARVGVTVLLLALGGSLVSVAFAQLVSVLLEQVLFTIVVRRRYPELHVRLSDFRLSSVRSILTFSMPVMLIGVGGYLSFQADPLVIGATIGVAQIPFFAVGARLVAALSAFSAAMAAVVMPAATKLHARGQMRELADLVMKWGRFAFVLAGVAVVFLVVGGPWFVGWWIGPEFARPAGQVLVILALGHLLLVPAQSVAFPVLVATGRHKEASIAFIAAGAINVIVSVALGKPLGVAGVALGTAIPTVLYAAYLLHLACREVGVPLREYSAHTALRPALGLAPMAVLLWWVIR
jgi:O-antigen/teichoic acid export membrane protein